MLSESRQSRSTGRSPTRGKLIQLPRIKPRMPGTVETFAASRAPEGRLAEIRAYLAQLLDTPQFSASSRRGQLLQYLVRETLAGNGDKITEYAIGLDVFRKPESFDPRIESVVRTEFSRLRQRLKTWYAEEGRRDRIVIDFPPRSYAAIFEFRDPNAVAEEAAAPHLVQEPAPSRRSASGWIIASVIAAVILAAAGGWMWKQRTEAESHQPIHSLVVLPFENYSSNHSDEYLADGMTDELTNDLAQWRDLRVVARTSAFAFKGKGEDVRQIGRQLNVDAVLEGSFTKDGDQIRITAQLNRAADGYHLWSHSYETQSNNLLSLQEQVANSITAAIRMVRGGGGSAAPVIHPATLNPEAEDLYLQAIFQLYQSTPDSTRKALSLFQAATDKDPSFARAYLGAGDAELNLVSMTAISSEEGVPRLREAAQKAIDLDPNLGSAWGELGEVSYTWDWNWDSAEVQFRRALERGAGAGSREDYGWSLATRGHFAEAHEQLRAAAEEDPLSIAPPFDEFFTYNFERDVPGQKRMVAQMLRLRPNFPGGPALAVVTAVQQHDCATATQESELLNRRYPALAATQSVLAYAAACRNDRAAALQDIARMEALKAPAYQLAIAWALLHNTDKTIAELTRSANTHEGQILYLRYDPFFDEVRSDPRYVALEKRVGLI